MANINIPFNCDYESINITVKCPIEGTDREEQTIIAQLKKDQNDWVFCTPGSIVSKNVKILNNEGSYEVIDSNGNFKGKIVGDILSNDGKVIVSVSENKITTNDLVVSKNTIVNNLTINGKLTVKNGLDSINISESSVSGNNSIVVLDNTDGNNMGLLVKNGMESEFLGFSKENNMFEVKTGASMVDDKIVGGQYGDLKARTLIADDLVLGNKSKGETVINIHDVITGDEKGTAHITTNSLTTVHHSSVFHTAISYDNGFANSENKLLNSLKGDIKNIFIQEKIGGTFDGNITNKYDLSELQNAVINNNKNGTILTSDFSKITKGNRGESYNQHWLTINEANKNPKFQWWVASDGNFSLNSNKKDSVQYKNVLTVQKEGLHIDGTINLKNKGETYSLTVKDLKQLKNLSNLTPGAPTLSGESSNVDSEKIEFLEKTVKSLMSKISNYENLLSKLNKRSENNNSGVDSNEINKRLSNIDSVFKLFNSKINKLEKDIVKIPNQKQKSDNKEIELLKKRIHELETKKTIVKQNGDEVVIDNSEVVNQYKNLESRFTKYEKAMPVLDDLRKETINKLVSENADLEGYSSFPVILNSNDDKKVQILNCRNFPNGQVHYYQLDGITANLDEVPIINLSDEIKNLKEKVDKRDKILPIVEEINELTNEGNSTPYLFVQKDKTNPEKMTIKFINKFKATEKDPAIHYFYQLNGDGVNNNSIETIDDETTKNLINKYKKFLPVHKDGEPNPEKDGPYINIEDDGTIKLVNFKNGEKYYYQLNGN